MKKKKIITGIVASLCIGATILGATLGHSDVAMASVSSVDVTPTVNKNVTEVNEDVYDVVFNATVSPACATNKNLKWTLSYANPDSDFATQYDISDVATISLSEDTHIATVQVNASARYDNISDTYKKGLGEVIVVTATSLDNGFIFASSTIGYANRLTLEEDFESFVQGGFTGLKLSAFGEEIPLSLYDDNFIDSVVYVVPDESTIQANYHVISADCNDWYTTYAEYTIGLTNNKGKIDITNPKVMFTKEFLEDLDSLYLEYLGLDDFYYDYTYMEYDAVTDSSIEYTDRCYLSRPSECYGDKTKWLYSNHTGFNIYDSVYKGLCESLRSSLTIDLSHLTNGEARPLEEGFSDFFDYLINEAYRDSYYPPLYVQSYVTNGYVNYEFDYYMVFDTSVKSVDMSNGPVVI